MILSLKDLYIRIPDGIEQKIKQLDDEPRPSDGAIGLDKIKEKNGQNAVLILEKLFKVIEGNAGDALNNDLLYQASKDLIIQLYEISLIHKLIVWRAI